MLIFQSVCPFNARHIVPKPELQMHISTCPDRRLIENEINTGKLSYTTVSKRNKKLILRV